MNIKRAVSSFSYFNRMFGKSEREWEEWRKIAMLENKEKYIQAAVQRYADKRTGAKPFVLKHEGIMEYQKEVCEAIKKTYPDVKVMNSCYLKYVIFETESQKIHARKMLAEAIRYRRKLLHLLTDEFLELWD